MSTSPLVGFIKYRAKVRNRLLRRTIPVNQPAFASLSDYIFQRVDGRFAHAASALLAKRSCFRLDRSDLTNDLIWDGGSSSTEIVNSPGESRKCTSVPSNDGSGPNSSHRSAEF